jgi:hypothetical protein
MFNRNARSRNRKPRIHSAGSGFRRVGFESLEAR